MLSRTCVITFEVNRRLSMTFFGCSGQLTCILKANHLAKTEAEVARKTDTIMAQADKDGDGVVTFDGTSKQHQLQLGEALLVPSSLNRLTLLPPSLPSHADVHTEFVIVCKKFPNILFPSTGKQ